MSNGDILPKFEIPLMLKGERVGIVDAVGLKDEEGYTTIVFRGYLLRDIKSQEMLVKLLQKEGMHLGKP